MSEQQQNIIADILKTIEDSQEVSDMSYSTANELISKIQMLKIA